MKKNINRILLVMLVFVLTNYSIGQEKKYAIAIHGGAGAMKKEQMDSIKEKAYIEKLNEALSVGEKMLKEGSKGIDVIVKVIQVMEESPLFNAGVGAVFTHDGKVELDASIMDGQSLKAGAVAGVTDVKSPIELAYRVMTNSPHVMLAGKGASEFAKKKGLQWLKTHISIPKSEKRPLKKHWKMKRNRYRVKKKNMELSVVLC
jgi:L-asparaginase / beta-aspartyl-peptidase